MSEPELRDTLNDLASRLPQYGRLSASLVQEGWMAAPQQSPLMDVLGVGGFYKVTRMIPVLRQVNQVLITINAVRYALNEMQPERANRHLHNAGLHRDQVERDFQTVTSITRRYTTDGAQAAGELAQEGVIQAGRAAGKGFRAFKRWRRNWLSDDS
jgi:hypothetical protein